MVCENCNISHELPMHNILPALPHHNLLQDRAYLSGRSGVIRNPGRAEMGPERFSYAHEYLEEQMKKKDR
jgi:hypothetical protein